MPEAVNLVENSKMAAQNIEEFFVNELTVLLFDKRPSNHKRHKRFIQLVEKAVDAPSQTQLEGTIEGTDLLWVRARFDQDCVQLNVLNKVKVEIFSKLSKFIKVESVELVTNVPKHDKTIELITNEQPFCLSKNSPISLESEFFVQDNLE